MSRGALLEQHMRHIARLMSGRARRSIFDGSTSPVSEAYLRACTYDDALTQTKLIYTRECTDIAWLWHLTISSLPRFLVGQDGGEPAIALDVAIVRDWPRIFFASALPFVEAEEPRGERAQRLGAWHWRLYCDAQWRPLIRTPRAPRSMGAEEVITP